MEYYINMILYSLLLFIATFLLVHWDNRIEKGQPLKQSCINAALFGCGTSAVFLGITGIMAILYEIIMRY